MRLKEQVAVVTGAARGIGLGIARCLAAEGASIGIVDIDGAEAEKAAAGLGVPAIGIAADMSQEREAIGAVDAVGEKFGGLDIMVNNAGGGGPNSMLSVGNPFTRVEQAGWDDQLTTNLRTTFAGCKAAIPHLERRGAGSIINIASIAGIAPNPAIPAYAAAKAGVIHLSRTLGLELGPKNIRVNAICPGLLWTRAWEMLSMLLKVTVPRYADMEPRDIFLDQVRGATPLGREQTPEDIGKLVVFLASADAQNITGQAIAVDGGITLRVGPTRDIG